MSEQETPLSPLEAAEAHAMRMNAENDALRARLEQIEQAQPITPEEQRRRHGEELFGILAGPNTGAGTIR